jgi:hypothetical protein
MKGDEGGAMSRTGRAIGLGRVVVLGVALALALLLLGAREAKAGKYAVAQCGWYVGADASWADTTGGAKFRPDSWCVPAAGQDPFAGVHLKSFTRDNQSTVSGTRFARWRWEAPAGTGISQVRGTWWHALHDGMEQRIGVGTWSGGFNVFASAAGTDTTPREFVAGFNPAQPALEDRLLCAKAESKWCGLSPGSWSAIRALTITIQDDHWPWASLGGDMLDGGWLRGGRKLGYSVGDVGGGLKQTEALVDGIPVVRHEHPCNATAIGGELRATTMRPCPLDRVGYYPISTGTFSDGPHAVGHCAVDFAGNVACASPRTVLIDNNPPAHPRKLTLAGGEGWRRTNDFDAVWANPDQGLASPIAGAFWRITGPAGFDSGVKYAAGRDIATLPDRVAPATGLYSLHLWLRDEAGNDAPASAVDVPLRLDEVPPGVAFEAAPSGAESEPTLQSAVQASIGDAHSGAGGGEISYRRIDAAQWTELPTKFVSGPDAGAGHLTAHVPPNLAAGTYLFRAEARDGAGNVASSTRRADGTQMVLRKRASVSSARNAAAGGSKTRLFARLRWRGHGKEALIVPFGAVATLGGRLVDADGAGLARRRLRIVSRPSRGALIDRRVESVETGAHGRFRLTLPAGPSRRVTVNFRGDAAFEPSRRPALALRVRSGIVFHATPRNLRTGEVVRLLGRVRTLAAPLPRRGKLVAVQYYETAARRWRPILVTRTDHSGHFKARYRFRYISGSAAVRLRAMVLPEERWPYVPGASQSVVVQVSG